jgi:hypothetical protein
MRFFDQSIRGFWRSFYVAVLAAPLWIIDSLIQLSNGHLSGGLARFTIAEFIGYVISWVAYPIAAFYLSRFLDREEQYVGFIVAYNWSSLVQSAAQTTALVIASASLLPFGLGDLVYYGVVLAILVYEWFVTRTALGVSTIVAAGFVGLDLAIGYLLYLIQNAEAGLS